MKRKQTRTGQKRSRKKGKAGKIFLLFILLGIAMAVIYLFRHEISNTLKPPLEKRDAMRGKRNVILYFSDYEGEYLIGERNRILKKDDVEEEAREVIGELVKGPKGKLIPTLPPQTKLLGLHLDEGGVTRLNFNQALTRDHPGGSSAEMMTIYSIVNSLALNFPQIKKVQILVEGKEVESIAGHLSLKKPISPKPDLIKMAGKNQGKN